MDRNSLTEHRERSVSQNTELNGQPCSPWGSRVSVVSFTDHLLCLRHICHTIGRWGKSESKFFRNDRWVINRGKKIKEREQILNSNLSWVHRTCLLFPVLCGALELSAAGAAAKSLQSCPTLCDPIDGSPPGSPIPGILQARTLEWVAISFSSAWNCKVKVKSLSRVRPLATPWTAAYQAHPSMGFSRQEYWSGVPLPSP